MELHEAMPIHRPPGPTRLQALQLVPMIRRNPIDFFQYMLQTYGPVSHFHIFKEHVYIVQEPEWIEQILVSGAKNYHKSPLYRELQRVVGQGLLTAEGDAWKKERRLLQPAFHAKRLKAYQDIMYEETEALAQRWQNQLSHTDVIQTDLHSEMMDLTFSIVGRCLFQADLSRYTERVKQGLETALVEITERITQLIPPPIWLPLPAHRRLLQALKSLDSVVQELIEERLKNPADDILSLMLQSRDEQGNSMSLKQVRDETLTLLLAGHETTANALTWTFYLLDQNRPLLFRAASEASDLYGQDVSEQPEKAAFLRAVFDESLRLFPPAWEIERRAVNRHTIKTSEGDVTIPEKTNIAICIYTLHRDERFWSEPAQFRPERFFMKGKRHGYAYLPFGAGPRICIGNQFAINEAMVILTTLLTHFDIEIIAKPEPAPLVTLRPRQGMPVHIRRRKNI